MILILDMSRAYDWKPEPSVPVETAMFMSRWAVWDTVHDRFLSWDCEWAWDDREELREAIVRHGNGRALEDRNSHEWRAYAMMPAAGVLPWKAE